MGGKLKSLQKLSDLKFLVPSFNEVPDELFQEWLIDKTSAIHKLKSICFRLVKDNPEKNFAVRSSANLEDSESDSFAGLFVSHLRVPSDVKKIEDAIVSCWESCLSERVQSYCKDRHIDTKQLSMTVVVQEFIEGLVSGVIFTVNPVNSRDDEVVIEWTKGDGELLVSGQVNPDQIILKGFDNETIIHENCPQKSLGDEIQIHELVLLARQSRFLQECYGFPLDIEWTFKNGQFYFLQARPITSMNYDNFDSVWTTADFRDGGVSSAVVSPIMWDLYGRVFSHSLAGYFQELGLLPRKDIIISDWFQVYFGRPYWNVEKVKQIQLLLPDFKEAAFDQDLSIPKVYDGQGRISGWTIQNILRAIPVLIKITLGFNKQKDICLNWKNKFFEIEKEWKEKEWGIIEQSTLSSHLKKLFQLQFDLESDYFKTIYNASNAKMFFMEIFEKERKKNSDLKYHEVIKNIGSLGVLEPAFLIEKLAQDLFHSPLIKQQIKLILKSNKSSEEKLFSIQSIDSTTYTKIVEIINNGYFHSTRELDLRVPRWIEDPGFILQSFLMSLDSTDSLKTKSMESNSQKSKKYSKSFSNKLDRLKEFLRLREEMRELSTKVYYFIRRAILDLNFRYKVDDLFFYASCDEIIEFIDHPSRQLKIVNNIKNRKKYALSYVNFKCPNELGLKDYHSDRRDQAHGSELRGLAASSGRIIGTARVLKSIHEAKSLQSGEIMVVPFTDPGWTPLFGLISGVITETGGLLSHAALIAREYGIPAILGVAGATDKIRSGMKIQLDGNSGRIILLDNEHSSQ